MIVTVTATVMDGTVVRWYDDRNTEDIDYQERPSPSEEGRS
jgi:hypothetical protein